MTNIDPTTGLPQLPPDYRFNVSLNQRGFMGCDLDTGKDREGWLHVYIERLVVETTGSFFWKERSERWEPVASDLTPLNYLTDLTSDLIFTVAEGALREWEQERAQERAKKKALAQVTPLLGPYPPNRLDKPTDTE